MLTNPKANTLSDLIPLITTIFIDSLNFLLRFTQLECTNDSETLSEAVDTAVP